MWAGFRAFFSPVSETSDSAVGRPRQLLVDVSIIARHDARTGIQRVVRAVWLHLSRADLGDVVVVPVIGSKRSLYAYADDDFLAMPVDIRSWRGPTVKPRKGDLFLGLDLATQILPKRRRQIAAWKRAGVTIHIVVYDLLPWLEPQWFTGAAVRHFRRWLGFIARHADGVVCISGTVRDDFAEWLARHAPQSVSRISLSRIAMGSDLAASAPSGGLPASSADILESMKQNPTILMVGTIEPRKGHDQALAALDWLWTHRPAGSPALLIVGKPGWKSEALQRALRTHAETERKLIWLEDVSDEFLELLYGASAGLLVASHAEGFGLPIIEALARRCPVLARRLKVFEEVSCAGIDYFDDDSPAALAGRIENFVAKRPNLHAASEYCEGYAWRQTCQDILHALALASDAPK